MSISAICLGICQFLFMASVAVGIAFNSLVGKQLAPDPSLATLPFLGMMGATAAASAGVYFARGDMEPAIAGPVGLGVLVGATIGARLLARAPKRALRMTFSLLLGITAWQMAMKGLR